MTVTPSEIFELALKRHREPWNWTLHFVGLVGFAVTLLVHSYLMFAASLIVFGAGFFDLKLPEPKRNRWFVWVDDAVDWEKDWVASPWNWYKTWRFLAFLLIATVFVWALVSRDGVVLCLFIGFAYLLKVKRENIDSGIEP